MTSFWDLPEWHAYEQLCGAQSGMRRQVLSNADWQTQVVRLDQPQAALWRGLRKSYKALIHKAERRYVIETWHRSGAARMMPTCQRVHWLESRAITRPERTWQLMGEWAENGKALLTIALDRTEAVEEMGSLPPCVGYVFHLIHGDWAYYFSGATLRKDISHALIWASMKALKARGVVRFELGWQPRSTDSEKDRSIAFFKSGFGGETFPAGAVLLPGGLQ